MLLATTVMLLVFRSPSATISVMWLISAKMFINEKPPFRLRKFHSIANLCATLNAATTFIMFIIYGTKFRSEFTRLYCGCLNKIKKPKRSIITRQESQQMKGLTSNNNTKDIDHEQGMNDIKTKTNSSITNKSKGKFYVELVKDNNTVTTSTATSNTSFSPWRRSKYHHERQRHSYDEEHDLMMNFNKNTQLSPRQTQVTIREDECLDNHNGTKSVLLTESYFDWFKSFISCH